MPPAPPPLDPLAAEAWSPLTGQPLALVELSRGEDYPSAPIVIGIDRAGTLPEVAVHDFAALVTTCPTAPAPWVSVAPGRLTAQLALIAANIAAAPLAATTFARVLRIGEQLPFAEALAVESLAYSTLLGGDEFRNWLAATQRPPLLPTATELVRYDRSGAHVTLTLSAPDTNNAMNAPMRDALWEGLADVLADPSRPDVTLRAQGRCFSTGGALDEFGRAGDLAAAHHIRMARSAALLVHRMGDRARVRLHGACIGSGIEIPAAAARRIGSADLLVQLPELRMGLMPGAGQSPLPTASHGGWLGGA